MFTIGEGRAERGEGAGAAGASCLDCGAMNDASGTAALDWPGEIFADLVRRVRAVAEAVGRTL